MSMLCKMCVKWVVRVCPCMSWFTVVEKTNNIFGVLSAEYCSFACCTVLFVVVNLSNSARVVRGPNFDSKNFEFIIS